MHSLEYFQAIFARYGGLMRSSQLRAAGVSYAQLQRLMAAGCVQKLRVGCYQWENSRSEVYTIVQLFPDAFLCMDTALRYYQYTDRTPAAWHLAVSKHAGKTRFRMDYPFVHPYYLAPSVLELGASAGEIDGCPVRIYDRDRLLCDCVRYRNKMDRELFNQAVQAYVQDPQKNVPRLLSYAESLHTKQMVKNLIGVWL